MGRPRPEEGWRLDQEVALGSSINTARMPGHKDTRTRQQGPLVRGWEDSSPC